MERLIKGYMVGHNKRSDRGVILAQQIKLIRQRCNVKILRNETWPLRASKRHLTVTKKILVIKGCKTGHNETKKNHILRDVLLTWWSKLELVKAVMLIW